MAEVALRLSDLGEVIRAGCEGRPVHCSWCNRLRVDDEWLDHDADGPEAARWRHLVETSSHGICPACFDRVQRQADAERRGRRAAMR